MEKVDKYYIFNQLMEQIVMDPHLNDKEQFERIEYWLELFRAMK